MIEFNTNKRYKWDDIASMYPDCWAIVTDVKEKCGAIETCRLLCICSFDEKAEFIHKYKQQGLEIWCERTTFAAPNVGFLC
jgi:hypothetical protein